MYEDQIEESTKNQNQKKASGQDKLFFFDPQTNSNSFKLAYGVTTS